MSDLIQEGFLLLIVQLGFLDTGTELRYKNCDTTIGPTGYNRFIDAEKQAKPVTTKIYQKYEVLEIITSFETANKYEVRNRLGEMVYFATEENNFCVRNCLGNLRPFTMVIANHMGQPVIQLVRPFRCDSCCCPCCLQELEIQAPPGLPVGYIKQLWHPFLPKFVIQDESHKDVLKIIGPCITSACFGNVVFEVMALDEQTSVGRICKKWGGVIQEFFTDVDFVGVSFPLDLDVKMKAVMLAAGFLLDFIFFEEGTCGGRCSVWC